MKSVLLLGAVLVLGCDDPELQQFVLDNGSVKAQLSCDFVRSSVYGVSYKATKFWDGSVLTSVFDESNGQDTGKISLFHKRDTAGAENALAVSSQEIHGEGGCASVSPNNVHIVRNTFYVDGDDLYFQIKGNSENISCVDTYSPVFLIDLSGCEGLNLEAFFN